MQSVAKTTTPSVVARSKLLIEPTSELAEPGQPEDGLGEERSAESEPDVHSQDRDDREQRVADDVPAQNACLRGALRARRAHVVLRQGLDHVRPDHPHVRRCEQHGERQPTAERGDRPSRRARRSCRRDGKKSQYPVMGKSCSLKPAKYAASNPIQTGCAEMPTRTITIVDRSSSERGRSADRIPTGIEISSQSTAPPKTSDAVTGAASQDLLRHVLAGRERAPERTVHDETIEELAVLDEDGPIGARGSGALARCIAASRAARTPVAPGPPGSRRRSRT